MAIHTPAFHPRQAPAVPNVGPALLAILIFALLAGALLLINPTATPIDAAAGLEAQRQGEINAGRVGPGAGYLIFRAGEINAANE